MQALLIFGYNLSLSGIINFALLRNIMWWIGIEYLRAHAIPSNCATPIQLRSRCMRSEPFITTDLNFTVTGHGLNKHQPNWRSDFPCAFSFSVSHHYFADISIKNAILGIQESRGWQWCSVANSRITPYWCLASGVKSKYYPSLNNFPSHLLLSV